MLNIKAEPPEVAVFARAPGDPLRLPSEGVPELAMTPVHLTALVAHPDSGASLEVRWSRCGIFDDLPCDAPLVALDAGPADELDIVPAQAILEALLESGSTGGSPISLAGTLVEDPRDIFNGFFAYVNTTVSVREASVPVDTSPLQAEKRLILYDPRLIATAIEEASLRGSQGSEVAAALGLPNLCSSTSEAHRQKLRAFLEERVPNRAPMLAPLGFDVIEGLTDTPTGALARGDLIKLRAGEVLALRPDVTFGSKETYSVIDGNCQLREFDENLSFSWFTRLGELTRHTSTDRAPVVNYTAPKELTSDGMIDRVWLVVRDGRGGSDHMFIDVELRN